MKLKQNYYKVLNLEACCGEKIESLCKAVEKAMKIASDIKK